jgi:uncharacterized protein involved in exopolysaccharide biosynthesis/Mrp family chromosome partitioning ATPase
MDGVRGSWQTGADQRAGSQSGFIGLSDILGFVRRYRTSILAFVAIGLVLAAAYVKITPPGYTARTQILIQPVIPQFAQQINEVNLSLDTAQVESQIAVLNSEKIASMVIAELQLNSNRVFMDAHEPNVADIVRQLVAQLPDGVPMRDRVVNLSLLRPADPPPLTPFEIERRAMALYQNRLSVRRVGVSYAIEIAFASNNAQLSADVGNAISSAYMREQIGTKAEAAKASVAWLEQRLEEMRTKMNRATARVQEFRARHDYSVNPNGQTGEPTLDELEVTASAYSGLYESLLTAYTNSVSQQSYQVPEARVITPASAPLSPSFPRKSLVLAFGAFAGLILGISSAFLRWTLDGSIRNSRQVREELGLELLGELPPVGRPSFNLVERNPGSRFVDALRAVHGNVGLLQAVRPMQTIGVTSALPSDGKSICAGNLATLYAKAGFRTLLIDADLYGAALTRKLMPDELPVSLPAGLTARHAPVLIGEHGVEFLSSNEVARRQLLGTKGMQQALQEFHNYDLVLIDLPSLSCGPDRLTSASSLDGVIVVAEWGETPRDLLDQLVRTLHASKASIIGLVMTNVRIPSSLMRRRRRRFSR